MPVSLHMEAFIARKNKRKKHGVPFSLKQLLQEFP